MRGSEIVALAFLLATSAGIGCSSNDDTPSGSAAAAGGSPSTSGATAGTAQGGAGGSAESDLEGLLARLRADRDGTLLDESNTHGWPVLVKEGRVVVSIDPALAQVAGDFDGWTPEPLEADQGFAYKVVPDTADAHYKLSDGTAYAADPWSRSYGYDAFGEISSIMPASAHLDRYFAVKSDALGPRTVRVWVPSSPATHVLYAADGQNLFDPGAAYGGWHLDSSAPDAMMIVAIDNTPARMNEYTQVPDEIDGNTIGGLGDDYADLVETVVRPLVVDHYGEPATRGLLGSSLGGLISLHVAERYPGEFAFAASMSGTLGWGSIGLHNETIIERYAAAGHAGTAIFLDSGGGGDTCADSDADGTDDDDPTASDNYCETLQMRDTLASLGYQFDVDLFHWHEPGATHDEAAWAARVSRPLGIFASLP